jgi:hypothetical protein
VAEESEAEWSIATNAVQAVFGNAGGFVDGVQAQVGELLGLQTAPHMYTITAD